MDETNQNGYPTDPNESCPPAQAPGAGQNSVTDQPQPAYVQPQPAYVQPQPAYVQPQPAYIQPQPAYVQPQPAYVQPQPAYVQPQPAYIQPQPAYVQPQPAYVQPQPAYMQPQPAPAYAQPQQANVQPQRRNNGKCIAGMVLGIVSISLSWIALVPYEAWIPIAMAITAIVLGSKGRNEISAGMPGHKMATTGRTLGIVSLILSVILAAVIILVFGTFLGIASREGYNL